MASTALLPTRMLDVRGCRVRYHAQGEGDDVLFLHGCPDTLQSWVEPARALAHKFRVHAFDWPGLGLSDAPLNFEYSFASYSRFIEDLMDVAKIRSARIVATGIAVPTALLLAARRPGRVERLFVFNGPVFERPHLLSLEMQALRVVGLGEWLVTLMPRTMMFLTLQRALGGASLHPDLYEDFQAQARRPRCRQVALELMRTSPACLLEVERQVSALRHPMRILWGVEDAFNPVEMGMLLKSACPHADFETVPECGRLLHLGQPDFFQQQLLEFLH